MTEIQDSTQTEEGVFTHSLSDYRSKVEEIIRTENERFRELAEEQAKGIIDNAWKKAEEIVNESQKKAKGIIAESEDKALAIISDSRQKALNIGNEIEQQAKQKSSEIIDEAQQKAQEIVQEAEENATKEAKNRVKSHEEKILSKAKEEADSIVENARKDAEKETEEIIESTKREAEQRVEEEVEKFRVQAQEQSTQIRLEAEKKATKLIDRVIEEGSAINGVIVETIKNSENLLEKLKSEMQTEIGELTKNLVAARKRMEKNVTAFTESSEEETVLQNMHGKSNNNMPIWATLKGDRTVPRENGQYLFIGQMELKILSAMDYKLVKQLKDFLVRVPNMKYLGESSSEEGSILSFEMKEPLPIMDILSDMPLVEDVATQGDSIKLILN